MVSVRKYISIAAVLSAIAMAHSLTASAQDSRKVQGCVYDEDGTALASVKVKVDDSDLEFLTDENGRFEGQVGIYNGYLTAIKDGYAPKRLAIDGTYLVFRLAHTMTAEEMRMKAMEKRQREDAYNRQYRNRGLIHSVELSYAHQHASYGYVANYLDGAKEEFDNYDPIALSYICSYRFNRFVQAGLGVGFLIHSHWPDKDLVDPGNWWVANFDMPIFANIKSTFTKTRFQPMSSFSIGCFPVKKEFLMEIGVGCNFRIDRSKSVYLLLTYGDTPAFFHADWESVGFRIGFSL